MSRPHREHSQFFNSQDSLPVRSQRPARDGQYHAHRGLDGPQDRPAEVIIPAAMRSQTVAGDDQQIRRRVRPRGGAVTNVTSSQGPMIQGVGVRLRQQRGDNAAILHAHKARPVLQRRLHMGGRSSRTSCFLAIQADARQRRLRRPRRRFRRWAMRTGDFSAVTHASTIRTRGDINGRTVRTRFENNRIPAERSSARSARRCWR